MNRNDKQADAAQETSAIEQIAQQWDGCMYDGVGETINIGEAIRAAGKRLLSQPAAAQEGFVLVPEVMDLDMEVAFCEAWFSKRRCIDDPEMQDAWAAALAARPQG